MNKNISDVKICNLGQGYSIKQSISFFCEEIAYRSGISCPVVKEYNQLCNYIIVGTEESISILPDNIKTRLDKLDKPGKEGFRIVTLPDKSLFQTVIIGSDDRGLFYGMMRVLRKLCLKNGLIEFAADFPDISMTPACLMRGHQLGYRDKQNTCPAWDLDDFDRYIRDLAIFGSNSIEILPPRTDDSLFSSHFKMDPFDMMIELSKKIHSYNMDVYVWYPYLNTSIEGKELEMELKEREKIFSSVPYIDGVLIPAGDPGELMPIDLFKVTEKIVKILHKYHPNAKVWLAPQSFAPMEDWYDSFYAEIKKRPEWLYGVCFGPWEMDTIEEMYKKLPEIYKNRIRHYPDITHNISSQFEIPDWDDVFTYTLGRESYNVRPGALKIIHNKHSAFTVGSITYSEGIHDDVNKMLWGELDFNPEMSPKETIEDYVRIFIDPDMVDELCPLILNMEKSWEGPVKTNEVIDDIYNKIMKLNDSASKKVKNNYRFQMVLLRAVSDYQTKLRYVYDSNLEKEAIAVLNKADSIGVDAVMEQAEEILWRTWTKPAGVKERHIMQYLADQLFQSKYCRIQLTTFRHKGQNSERGAYLDSLFYPLNDSQWYLTNFDKIKELSDEKSKLARINEMLSRYNPGENGMYYNMGDYEGFRHTIKHLSWEEDPGFLRSPLMAHNSGMYHALNRARGWYNEIPIPLRWFHGARTLYGTPLEVKLKGLNPDSNYKIRITYPNMIMREGNPLYMNFWAGDNLIHSAVNPKSNEEGMIDPVYEYDLPQNSYESSNLYLKWQTYKILEPCTVSEIWIIKK